MILYFTEYLLLNGFNVYLIINGNSIFILFINHLYIRKTVINRNNEQIIHINNILFLPTCILTLY